MQNERIDAIPAVLERLMSMQIDKSRWNDATRAAAIRLESWPIEELSGTIIHIIRAEVQFLARFFDRYQHHVADMRRRVEGLFNDRPVKCHSQLAAGVEALATVFPALRPEWIAETLDLIDTMAIDRQQSAGGDHPLVADFWEKVDYLLSREKAEAVAEGFSINLHRKPDQLIAINLPMFEAHCRNAGIAPPHMDALKKVLRSSKSRKFVNASVSVNAANDRVYKCWLFEQPVAGRGGVI